MRMKSLGENDFDVDVGIAIVVFVVGGVFDDVDVATKMVTMTGPVFVAAKSFDVTNFYYYYYY